MLLVSFDNMSKADKFGHTNIKNKVVLGQFVFRRSDSFYTMRANGL